ncbi:MAG: hypothetical protein WBQ94_04230 [Terracidiphilus sp.]
MENTGITAEEFECLNLALAHAGAGLGTLQITQPNANYPEWIEHNERATRMLIEVRVRALVAESNARIAEWQKRG